MKDKKIFLMDGSYMFYRAYFSLMRTPLFNKKGENTTATYGFINQLFKLIVENRPEYMAVVFDTKEPTFRHDFYPEYKATREKMPEDMAAQYPRIVQLVQLLGIPTIEMPGYEADDIIGTFAQQAAQQSMDVYMVTADKDYMQLVSDKIKLYNPWGKNGSEILDVHGVQQKMELRPDQIVDYLALMGDSSDNVPGVKGIGAKSALKLLMQFETLENLLSQTDQIKSDSIRKKIEEGKEQALLSKKLVTIDTHVPVELRLEDLEVKSPETDKVLEIFKELEFQGFIERFQDIFPDTGVQIDTYKNQNKNYRLITNKDEFRGLLEQLSGHDFWVFDSETTGLNVWESEIIGLSFSWEEDSAAYVPFSDLEDISVQEIIQQLKPIFENPEIKKGGQNIKYDALMLVQHGIFIQGIEFDTMIADYLLNPGGRNHNLDSLALRYLNYKMIPIEELIGKKGKNQKNMSELTPQQIYEYACEDADITFKLYKILKEKLMQYNLLKLFKDVEMPLLTILIEMEKNGVKLDLDHMRNLSQQMAKRLDELVASIYEIAGKEFNINSPQQLGKILYDEMEIHVKKGLKRPPRTAKGSYSTSESALQKLEGHPIVDLILEYRQLSKLKNTYVDIFPTLVSSKTGRLHASFNQTITATGRLSSSDPNLQNIPIRTEIGREIRKAFIPEEKDWWIVSADYSQIELRLLAELSGDESLLQAFKHGADIHTATASMIFNVPREEVTSDHRRKAKEINFGIIYGMNEYGLASRLKISPEEAKEIITNYFAQFPKVNTYIMNVLVQANRKKYVETILGRRRYIPEIDSKDRNTRENAERQAVNTTIQGSAADLIKLAMINIQKAIHQNQLQSKMIMQIHDELVFEVPDRELEEIQSLVKQKMETAMSLQVPLKVDIGAGKNWLEAHE
ncbi:MAG: DNA polymerase I [Calditrichia bacterium]